MLNDDAAAPSAERPAHRRLPPRLATVLAVGVLCSHFFIVWLYLTPTNPLKIALVRQVTGYMHPLFVQNWQLFAPVPVAHDELMLVKVRWQEYPSHRQWESEWIDVTTPVHQAIHRTRVGPYSKLARPFTGIREMAEYTDPVAQAMREKAVERAMTRWDDASRKRPSLRFGAERTAQLPTSAQLDRAMRPSPTEREQRRRGREIMYRLASAHASRTVGPDGRVLAVNIRFATREFPRFSDRHLPDTNLKSTYTKAYGWEAPRGDVALLR